MSKEERVSYRCNVETFQNSHCVACDSTRMKKEGLVDMSCAWIHHFCHRHMYRMVVVRMRDGRRYYGRLMGVDGHYVYLRPYPWPVAGGTDEVTVTHAVGTGDSPMAEEVQFFFPGILPLALFGILAISLAPWGW